MDEKLQQRGKFSHHGGRLLAARVAYPLAPQPWLDLSTGISPYSYPAPKAASAARARLPDRESLAELEAIAARAFGVDEVSKVIAVPGTESGLRLVPLVLQLSKSNSSLGRGSWCVRSCMT